MVSPPHPSMPSHAGMPRLRSVLLVCVALVVLPPIARTLVHEFAVHMGGDVGFAGRSIAQIVLVVGTPLVLLSLERGFRLPVQAWSRRVTIGQVGAVAATALGILLLFEGPATMVPAMERAPTSVVPFAGGFAEPNTPWRLAAVNLAFALVHVLAVETVFREWLFVRLRERMDAPLALIVAAAAYATLLWPLDQWTTGWILGVLLGLARTASGSLLPGAVGLALVVAWRATEPWIDPPLWHFPDAVVVGSAWPLGLRLAGLVLAGLGVWGLGRTLPEVRTWLRGRSGSHPAVRAFVAVGVQCTVVVAFVLLLLLPLTQRLLLIPGLFETSAMVAMVLQWALTIEIVRSLLDLDLVALLPVRGERPLTVVWTLVLVLGLSGTALLVPAVDPGFEVPSTEFLPLWISLLVFAGVAPFFEEIFFRRILLDLWARAMRPRIALLASAFLFGLYHHGPLLHVAHAAFFGLAAGWLYLRTRSLVLCWLLHAGVNLLALLVPGDVRHGLSTIHAMPRAIGLLMTLGLVAAAVFALHRRLRATPPEDARAELRP